jgi:hypothetical protein
MFDSLRSPAVLPAPLLGPGTGHPRGLALPTAAPGRTRPFLPLADLRARIGRVRKGNRSRLEPGVDAWQPHVRPQRRRRRRPQQRRPRLQRHQPDASDRGDPRQPLPANPNPAHPRSRGGGGGTLPRYATWDRSSSMSRSWSSTQSPGFRE